MYTYTYVYICTYVRIYSSWPSFCVSTLHEGKHNKDDQQHVSSVPVTPPPLAPDSHLHGVIPVRQMLQVGGCIDHC